MGSKEDSCVIAPSVQRKESHGANCLNECSYSKSWRKKNDWRKSNSGQTCMQSTDPQNWFYVCVHSTPARYRSGCLRPPPRSVSTSLRKSSTRPSTVDENRVSCSNSPPLWPPYLIRLRSRNNNIGGGKEKKTNFPFFRLCEWLTCKGWNPLAAVQKL